MKVYIIFIFVFILSIINSFGQTNDSHVYVRPHFRKNGTYIEGYWRTAPNNTNMDNFSTKGNYNPYTGEAGSISPDNKTSYDSDIATNIYQYSTNSIDRLKGYFMFSASIGVEFCLGFSDSEIKKQFPNTDFNQFYISNYEKVLQINNQTRRIMLFFDENSICYKSIFMSKYPEVTADKINLIAEKNITYDNDGKRIVWLLRGEREKIATFILQVKIDGEEYMALGYQILGK